jgi:hypothetical protein
MKREKSDDGRYIEKPVSEKAITSERISFSFYKNLSAFLLPQNDNRAKNRKKGLTGTTLQEAVMVAINSVVEDRGEFGEAFRENVIRIIGSYSADSEPTEYDEQLDSLRK